MNCNGIDITNPLDRMPEGYFPYLQDVRVIQEGRIESRPGYTTYLTPGGTGNVHSIRRLNDEVERFTTLGFSYNIGQGTEVLSCPDGVCLPVSSGFSGDPLSIINFRPDQSPDPWAYIYDRNKQIKVRADRKVDEIGMAPPPPIIDAEYGPPAWVQIDNGQSAAGWAGSGSAGAPSTQSRFTIAIQTSTVLYNVGTTGWACISVIGFGGLTPLVSEMGTRMRVTLNAGSGNAEEVTVREIHPSGLLTTIAGIQYDSGATGDCTIVLSKQPVDSSFLQRNQMLILGGTEHVRVLSSSLSPDGETYSIRVSTVGTFAIGASVESELTFYIYTINTHGTLEPITSNWVQSINLTAGVSTATLTKAINVDASTAMNRPISMSEDYLHISFYCQPSSIAYIRLRLYLVSAAGDFYEWTISPNELIYGWNDLSIPLSRGIRVGDHTGQTIARINTAEITVVMNTTGTIGFEGWYFFGTYGPEIDQASPTGYVYAARVRDPFTGAYSVPSPQTRWELFPLREQVIVQPAIVATAISDWRVDIYRQGGTLSDMSYVGTSSLSAADTAYPFFDEQPDAVVIANGQVADFTALQPWPILQPQWSGIVNVVGTTVTWVSGDQFDLDLLSNSVILIAGVAYQTYGQPDSVTRLQLFRSAGVQNGVNYQIASPTLAQQPLPFAFGPLEGPLAPVVFALGDPLNPGTLYWSNPATPDAASDANTLEITAPSEPLISGAVWNGLVFVGSRDNLFLVRYSYLQTLGQPTAGAYQFQRLPAPSGMWSRWAVCAGQDGVYYLGRDGVYRATEAGAVSVTDAVLYQLFPHDGEPADGANGLGPVDMNALTSLRLAACDNDIYFDYAAVGD